MKTIIRNTLTAARRHWLRFQIRTLEVQIDGMGECLECVTDTLIRLRIGTARAVARRELARLRSEYSETLPVGRRVVWGQA